MRNNGVTIMLSISNLAATTLCAVAFLDGCAGIAPPSGGPVDTVPPAIVASNPSPDQTDVHPKKITLEFSKYVDETSVQGSVFISPYLGNLEYSWSGKEVDITFADTLRRNTTYVVTVGTDVVDLNNRNKMAQAYSLAFSTGDSIDHGIIGGRVYDDKPEGIFLFAYRLEGRIADTLNPAHTRPDFVSQTGKGGNYSLQNVPDGRYRLLAVRDEYRNLLYDPGTDDYGVPFRPIVLDSTHRISGDIRMQMSREDTARLELLLARSSDNRHITLRFNRNLDPASVQASDFHLFDSLTQHPVNVYDWYAQGTKLASVTLVTDTLAAGRTYGIDIAGIKPENGEPPAPQILEGSAEGAAVRDTSRPRLAQFTPLDSVRDVPFTQTIELRFEDAVRRDSLEKSFMLADSAGHRLKGTIEWLGGAAMRFRPLVPLQSAEWYLAEFKGASAVNYLGRTLRDSIVRRHFRTIDAAALSSISGTVVDSLGRQGGSIVIAKDVASAGVQTFRTVADATGTFKLENLPEGRYVLRSFEDPSGSGFYSYGKPYPFVQSAPFVFYPDTLKLRARWPLEDIRIRIE